MIWNSIKGLGYRSVSHINRPVIQTKAKMFQKVFVSLLFHSWVLLIG